jgi:4-amino-4-deoxy-L-arabinose transferase-like glycosyltransferase
MTDKKDDVTRFEIIFLLLLALSIFGFRLISLNAPPDRDEGTYAYIAHSISSHELPYRDIFDHKPPLAYFIYTAAFSVFGENMEGVRNFTTCYVIAAMLLVYMLARTVSGPFGAMASAFFYALFQNNIMMQGMGANMEVFTQFPLIAAMLFLVDRDRDYEHVNFFVAGFFTAVACLVKSMIGFFAAGALIYIFIYSERKLRNTAWFIAGFAVCAAGAAAWVMKNGIMNEFINCVFTYNIGYPFRWDTGNQPPYLIKGTLFFIRSSVLVLPGLAYFIYMAFKEKKNSIYGLVVIAFISVYLGIVFLHGVYPHYYLVLAGCSAMIAGISLNNLYVFMAKKRKTAAAITTAFIMIISVGFYLRTSLTADIIKTGRYAFPLFYESQNMAGIINGSKDKATTLFVWPDEPEIYFLTGIKAPGKYIYAYPLEKNKEGMESLTSAIYGAPPDYIVMEKGQEGVFNGLLEGSYGRIADGKYLELFKKNGVTAGKK